MKKQLYIIMTLLGCIGLSQKLSSYNSHPPKLTIVIVIDQFAHHYINKLYPHLKYGLKYLLDNGVNYTNAHMPHGRPSTATGHAALNTGTYASMHGFVDNDWITENGKKVPCDDDSSENALVFTPDGRSTYNYGKSAHMLMTDGLSDQCVIQSEPGSIFRSFSISGKSRSAIATASKLGKAVWFDPLAGTFTSSKAYFDELPTWLNNFNQIHNVNKLGTINWQRMYPKSPFAYNFFNINDYEYSKYKESMLNRELPVPDPTNTKNPYYYFERSPFANKLLLELAQKCIYQHVNRKNKDRLLLWVCLSPLDKLAHEYGPQSIEAIDMIYHLDKQLQKFIRRAMQAVGKHQVAIALTADHGIMPIPEILQNEGFSSANRINQNDWIAALNKQLSEKYNISDLIINYKGQELILNQSLLKSLSLDKQKAVTTTIKELALEYPHVKQAWTVDELLATPTQQNSLEDNIKKQLYKGRCGDIVIQPRPFTLITPWADRTSHKSPYDYDTHVPFLIFHPGKFEKKYVRQRVTTLQLASTLAELLNIPKPSASTAEVLPELFDPEYQ